MLNKFKVKNLPTKKTLDLKSSQKQVLQIFDEQIVQSIQTFAENRKRGNVPITFQKANIILEENPKYEKEKFQVNLINIDTKILMSIDVKILNKILLSQKLLTGIPGWLNVRKPLYVLHPISILKKKNNIIILIEAQKVLDKT